MASKDEVEAVISDPNFEIITTFAYSTGLPHNPESLPGSHCYLLQHGIDRDCLVELGCRGVYSGESQSEGKDVGKVTQIVLPDWLENVSCCR